MRSPELADESGDVVAEAEPMRMFRGKSHSRAALRREKDGRYGEEANWFGKNQLVTKKRMAKQPAMVYSSATSSVR